MCVFNNEEYTLEKIAIFVDVQNIYYTTSSGLLSPI